MLAASSETDMSRISPHLKPVKGRSEVTFPAGATGDAPRHLYSGTIDRPEAKLIPMAHNNLPFSRSKWEKVTNAFLIHKVILFTRRNRCQSTYLACKQGHTDVEVHTAVSAPYNQPGSISMSCTYFSKPKLSLAVIYGCDSNQLRRVTRLLRESPEVATHPLLMVGIFAELQLNRIENLVMSTNRDSDTNIRAFENHWSSNKSLMIRELNNRLRNGVLKANEAAEEIRAAKAQLKEMADRFEDQKGLWKTWQTTQGNDNALVADRFKCRFGEIDVELDGKMMHCRLAADRQTQIGTTVRTTRRRSTQYIQLTTSSSCPKTRGKKLWQADCKRDRAPSWP